MSGSGAEQPSQTFGSEQRFDVQDLCDELEGGESAPIEGDDVEDDGNESDEGWTEAEERPVMGKLYSFSIHLCTHTQSLYKIKRLLPYTVSWCLILKHEQPSFDLYYLYRSP